MTTLQDSSGVWVDNPITLESIATNFFKELFTATENVFPYHFPTLDDFYVNDLDRMPTDLEIYHSIKNIGAYKAPAPDGFQVVFYHSQWKTIGVNFCNFLKELWNNPGRIEDINATFLALIPKTDVVTMMKQFRPIGLCNVVYKIITKIITSKIRGILPHLVGPAQCSFIPKRHSQDNIIIAQEIFSLHEEESG